MRLDGSLATIELDGEHAICGGGASLAAVVRRATDAGLSGIEFGCAIPGTVGGAVRMNAGAYGGELRDVLVEALVVSADGVRRHGPDELEMRYRHSNVGPGEVVAVAMLRLRPAPREQVRATVKAMQARRTAAQPRKARTFGSVFKNPDEGPGAGQLLEACGLKGFAIGGAQISPVHANFIENVGGATSADVAALIGEGRRRVREQHGVELEHEVELLGAITIAVGQDARAARRTEATWPPVSVASSPAVAAPGCACSRSPSACARRARRRRDLRLPRAPRLEPVRRARPSSSAAPTPG